MTTTFLNTPVDPEAVAFWADQLAALPQQQREGWLYCLESSRGALFAQAVRRLLAQGRAA